MPNCIVHCAAQRFPDKVDKDLDGTIRLNVEATKNLAVLAGNKKNVHIDQDNSLFYFIFMIID
jgi:dTDP-4-dehydrorhamnose reductase